MRSFGCHSLTPLDFDAVIADVSSAYPGTRVVQPDWYAQRHQEEIAVANRIGMPIPNPVLQSLERVWAERGLQRGFEVPIRDGLTLYARLDKLGGYFLARDSDFEDRDIDPLIKILKSFSITISW